MVRCGPFAQCFNGVCECAEGYEGDPNRGCQRSNRGASRDGLSFLPTFFSSDACLSWAIDRCGQQRCLLCGFFEESCDFVRHKAYVCYVESHASTPNSNVYA